MLRDQSQTGNSKQSWLSADTETLSSWAVVVQRILRFSKLYKIDVLISELDSEWVYINVYLQLLVDQI